MKKIIVKPGVEIELGKRGENLARCVVFDISAWEETYGEGTVHLLHQRNGDKEPYPCVIKASDGIVRWNITEIDVDVAGRGRAELQYYVGESRVKSETWVTRTERTLNNAGPVPGEPAENWIDTMLELGTETMQNAEAAKDSAEAAAQSAQNAATSEMHAEIYADSTNLYLQDAISASRDSQAARDEAITAQRAAEISEKNAADDAEQADGFKASASVSAALAGQSEKRAAESAATALASENAAVLAKEAAEQAVGKTSFIGDNGNWYEWSAAKGLFVDTGVPAQGPKGDKGDTGKTGAKGEKGDPSYPDWDQNDPSAANYIKNRPIYVDDEWGVFIDERYEGVLNVKPDWDQTDSTQLDYIKNRPVYLTPEGNLKTAPGYEDLLYVPPVPDWNQNDDYEPDYIKNRPLYLNEDGMPEVAPDYEDLFIHYIPDWNQNGEGANDYIKNRPMYVDRSGEVVIEEPYREAIKGISPAAEQVQPDWTQNDSTQSDYIKNRPFYAETAEIEILPETELEYNEDMEHFDFGAAELELVVGDTYIVTWNGVEYECVVWAETVEDVEYISLGGHDYPFQISPADEAVVPYDGSTEATLRIVHVEGGVVVIEGKYKELFQADWNQNDETAPDYVKNRPFYEGEEAVEIYPETELEYNADMESFRVDIDSEVVAGDTYLVTWNGTEYECVAWVFTNEYDDSDDGNIILGGENYPFHIDVTEGDVYPNDGSTEATLQICHVDGIAVHPIDLKFLPEEVVTHDELNATLNGYATEKYVDTAISEAGGSKEVKWEDITGRPFSDGYLLPETTIELDGGLGGCDVDFVLVPNRTYFVTLNGTEYELVASRIDDVVALSNAVFSIEQYDDRQGDIEVSVENVPEYSSVTLSIKDSNYGKIYSECLPTETWTFTLEDGTVIEKKVVVAE